MSGVSKNPDPIHQNNFKHLAGLNKLTYNRVKELKIRFSNGPNKHLSRGQYRLRPDCIPPFDEWASFTEHPPSPQPYWPNQQQHQRGNSQQSINHQQGTNQQAGHHQRGPVFNSQQKSLQQSQQKSTQQQPVPNPNNATTNGQTSAPEKKVDLSLANMLLSLGINNKKFLHDKELKALEEQGRLSKGEEQGRPPKKNGDTNSTAARRTHPPSSQRQRRHEEVQKAPQVTTTGVATKTTGKQPATKKLTPEGVVLPSSVSGCALSLTKCQNLLETYENIRKGRKKLTLPKEDDVKKLTHKRNKDKEVAMKRPQKRPALKGRGKDKVADLDENVETSSVKEPARPEQFIVTLKRGSKRSRDDDDAASSKPMTPKKRKIEVQTDNGFSSINASSSNTISTSADNDKIMRMASEAHKRYEDLFKKATNVKRRGDQNHSNFVSDYADAACYYAEAFYEQLIAASLGHDENVVNPAAFMNHVINKFDKDKKIQAAFCGLKALIIRRFFIFEDKRVRPLLKDTILRYNELIETTGRLSEQTLTYKRDHYNKTLSESNKVEEMISEFTKYWDRATKTYKQLGFGLDSDIKVAVDYVRSLLKEWSKDNDSKSREAKKSTSQTKSRSTRY
ncbi:10499_t:CDS:2 [Funneliformis mosseae]|uniref:10499_t:CDS:1 n=1 Tax=Funneliformis mosseae TaxID=27381 RepID=A0A9N9ANR6_FUNMO|nr:10499_t:CDS:2 [Funneliformis mosseae]